MPFHLPIAIKSYQLDQDPFKYLCFSYSIIWWCCNPLYNQIITSFSHQQKPVLQSFPEVQTEVLQLLQLPCWRHGMHTAEVSPTVRSALGIRCFVLLLLWCKKDVELWIPPISICVFISVPSLLAFTKTAFTKSFNGKDHLTTKLRERVGILRPIKQISFSILTLPYFTHHILAKKLAFSSKGIAPAFSRLGDPGSATCNDINSMVKTA